ncbi:MAG: trypsin-like peptidase domain-containing protein [Pirellulales bacterium]
MVTSLLYGLLALVTGSQNEFSVLYFQSSQCEPCRQMEPALEQLRQQGWNIQKIDAPNQLDLARHYQIKNLPTLILLNNDRESDRIVGAATFEQMQSRFARAAARNSSTPHLQSTQLSGLLPRQNNQPIVRGQSPSSSAGQLASNSFASSSASSTLQGGDFPMLGSRPTPDRSPRNNSTIGSAPNGNTTSSSATQPASFAPASPATSIPNSFGNSSGQSDVNSFASNPRRDSTMGTSNSSQPAISIEAAMARASDATLRIKVEEPKSVAHGTGTIVAVHGSEGLVLTCGHLFRDMLPGSKLTVDMFAGTPRQVNVPAELIDFKAKEEDIALLAVKLPVQVEPVPILPKSEALQQGQRVFSFGCDHGNNPTRRDTAITRINRYVGPANVEIEGAPAVGRSGGGLFDMQGRLIGVCNAACNDENEGIYAAADVIYNQLARAGQTALFQPSSASSPASLASGPSARSSTAELPNYAATQNGRSDRSITGGSSNQFNSNPANTNSSAVSQGSATWPDEDPRLAVGTPSTNNASLGSGASPVAANSSTTQLICIVKDPSTGKDRVLTINQPSSALLQAIEQQGQMAP